MNGEANIGAMDIAPMGGMAAEEVGTGISGCIVFDFLADGPPSSSLLSAPSAVMILPAIHIKRKLEKSKTTH